MKLLSILCLLLSISAFSKEEKRKCKLDRDYWLYTPDKMDKDKTYWLVVAAHTAGGKGAGASGLSRWVRKMDNIVVVGPTFPNGFQRLGVKSDTQVLNIYKELSKEFKLHEKMFLYGFSAGSQFSHRFASKHAKKVIGVSAHSGGSWDSKPARKAGGALWTISCGLKDKSRIGMFRTFCKGMLRSKFTSKPFVTEAGHSRTPEVHKSTEECFRVATTGMFDYQRKATEGMTPKEREGWISKDTELVTKEFDDGSKVHKLKVNEDGWTVGKAGRKAMAATRKMLDELAQ